MKHQAYGFSLVELLISLFLTGFVMNLLITYYIHNKKHYLETTKKLAQHFEMQWIDELLRNSIRRSGFTPCLSIEQLIVKDHRVNTRPTLGFFWSNLPNPALHINRMNEQFTTLTQVINRQQLRVAEIEAINPKNLLIIADCEHAEIHRIREIKGRVIHLTHPLAFDFAPHSFVGEWLEEKWLIKPNGQGQRSLYYGLGRTDELSSLVHAFQVKEHKGRVVTLDFELEENKTHQLIVAVRH